MQKKSNDFTTKPKSFKPLSDFEVSKNCDKSEKQMSGRFVLWGLVKSSDCPA